MACGGCALTKQEHDELAGWPSHERARPVAPPLREDPWSIDGLEAELDFARAYAAERARISALPVVDFDVEAVAAQWAAFDLWCERDRFQRAASRADDHGGASSRTAGGEWE